MSEEIIKDEEVKEVADLTPEEQAAAWEDWVRARVNAALDIYLPVAKQCDVNIAYEPKVIEKLESGTVYSENEMVAAQITLIFDFKEPIDVTQPREEAEVEEAPEEE